MAGTGAGAHPPPPPVAAEAEGSASTSPTPTALLHIRVVYNVVGNEVESSEIAVPGDFTV